MNRIDRLHAKNRYLQGIISLIQYVYRRVDEEQLTQVAGNITYTLILGIVPALAVALAIFTYFPQFEALQKMVELYFMQGMIPPGMARGILDNLALFASKASSVSIVSSLAMFFTTAMMFNLIENTFNRIWGVQEPRPFFRRMLIYFFIATLGPLLLGGSLYLTSYLYLVGKGIVGKLPYLNGIWPALFLAFISAAAFTFLYRFVPYRRVLWKDAFLGGLFASVAFEVAKRLFAVFVMQFASYQRIYGAIALIPMFLLWLYVSSLIMLSGAVLVSSLPDFRSGRWRRVVTPGSQYADALSVMHVLFDARAERNQSVGWTRLQRYASLSSAELENLLLSMQEAGWVRHAKQGMRIIFRRRRKTVLRASLDEWRWIGDATRITLADVFSRFVFQPDEEDALSCQIIGLLEKNLGRSLADYFEEMDKRALSGDQGVAGRE
ncbi:MAG: YihY family inner membrane protein [Alistipes senegalensis]|nr:YihY family inner membrane protein [Oxalobacter formigenes]MCM1281147.1 YihY family inner membrane protein [Alistipes senegalensis]